MCHEDAMQLRQEVIDECTQLQLSLPDARKEVDRFYTLKELEGLEQISTCDVTNNMTAKLKDGTIAVLYGIDFE